MDREPPARLRKAGEDLYAENVSASTDDLRRPEWLFRKIDRIPVALARIMMHDDCKKAADIHHNRI